MANTVNIAFNEFMSNSVNLDTDDTTNAKASRKWLMEQMQSFPEKDNTFPELYSEKNIYYGSFSRKTMKRPLDDIDIMLCLKANKCYYKEINDRIEIYTENAAAYFSNLCHEGSNILNSKKVINKILANLSSVPQYKNSEMKRNMEAATLSLLSYDWVYDIVPCFYTVPNELNKTFYVIPDGKGHWKKTDPRLDQKRAEMVNKIHGGYLLQIIRLVKYWNKRPTMPTIPSYLLENMILDYYVSRASDKASNYIDIELTKVIYDIRTRIYNSVNDPKEIQGNLNVVAHGERLKISERAQIDYNRAIEARKLEDANDHKKAIEKWAEILGDNFPKYD